MNIYGINEINLEEAKKLLREAKANLRDRETRLAGHKLAKVEDILLNAKEVK